METDARREVLLALNPHIYYDENDRYDMAATVIPTGRWIPLALAVRSFGWGKVERNPEVPRMLDAIARCIAQVIDEVDA